MIIRATGLQGLEQNNAFWTSQGCYMPELTAAVPTCARPAQYLVSQDSSMGGVSPLELLTVDDCWRIQSQFSLRGCPTSVHHLCILICAALIGLSGKAGKWQLCLR